MLFDLAYFKYRRFALIDEDSGYFVSRLKKNANPMVRRNYGNGAAAPFP
jgi:putative transposase